jgi:hypothetical protein
MTVQNQIKQIESQIRLRSLRAWATGLAVCLGTTTLLFIGVGMGELHNPRVWTSAFSVMAHGGLFRQFVFPLACISIVLFAIALVLHLLIDKTLKLEE